MAKDSENTKGIRVTQKAIVLRKDGKFLTLFRSKTAPSFPLSWDLPGGQLEYGEDPVAGIVREIKEESGLDVSNVKIFDVFGHENAVGYWVTIAYRCDALSEEVALSYEHIDYRWVTKEEFLKLPSMPKNIHFVNNFLYERNK
ncbi:MAG: NUDIX domain-containing protein [Patescibacteria group bacterium]